MTKNHGSQNVNVGAPKCAILPNLQMKGEGVVGDDYYNVEYRLLTHVAPPKNWLPSKSQKNINNILGWDQQL